MDLPRDGWQERAACRDEDPELFFPVGSLGPAAQQEAKAKAVCARCPVVEQCLAYAMQTGQDYGIWGGMTPDERRALARRNRRSFRIDSFDNMPSSDEMHSGSGRYDEAARKIAAENTRREGRRNAS